ARATRCAFATAAATPRSSSRSWCVEKMRTALPPVLLACALAGSASLIAQRAPSSPGGVQGIVVKARTEETLARAIVELRGDDDRLPAILSTTTDGEGRFLFQGVAAGRYRVVVTRPGFVRRTVDVTVAGGRVEEITAVLTATGAISGRVYGQTGEGLGNIEVAAL